MATLTSTRPTAPSRVLVVHSNRSGFRVLRVSNFLTALEETYNGLFLLNSLLDEQTFPANVVLRDEHGDIVQQRTLRSFRRYYRLLTTPQSLRRAALVIQPKCRLQLRSVELHSPGTWKFVGDVIPIDAIRKWFRDAHERRKDKKYREAAEEESLELDNKLKTAEIDNRDLENELKRLEIFDRKIELAKKLGATEEDLKPLLRNLLYRPLKRLEQYDDIIDSVEVSPDDDGLE